MKTERAGERLWEKAGWNRTIFFKAPAHQHCSSPHATAVCAHGRADDVRGQSLVAVALFAFWRPDSSVCGHQDFRVSVRAESGTCGRDAGRIFWATIPVGSSPLIGGQRTKTCCVAGAKRTYRGTTLSSDASVIARTFGLACSFQCRKGRLF